jgi:hypothetical protein
MSLLQKKENRNIPPVDDAAEAVGLLNRAKRKW